MAGLSFLTRPFLAARLARAVTADGLDGPLQELSQEPHRSDTRLWLSVAERLVDAGRREDAASLLRSAPESVEVLEVRARLEALLSCGEARPLLERLVALRPGDEAVARALAGQLVDEEELELAVATLKPFGEDVDADTALVLGEALFGLERFEEALAVVRPHLLKHEADARSMMSAGLAHTEAAQGLRALHDELVSLLGGDEALTVDLAARRQLDGGSALNHKLLAKSLMVDVARLAPVLELRSVAATRELGEALRAEGKDEAQALVQLAQAELRAGETRDAHRLFTRAREFAPDHFGAALGEAAALDSLQRALVDRALKLPQLPVPRHLERVVPDWPALAPLEQRVVVASVAPLEWLLLDLAQAGCRIRVLPLDVRPVDLPELADLAGETYEDDHRSWEGIEGLASATLAVAKVETLFDVTNCGWTFGHEFAHLCELRLKGPARRRLDALYERALDAEYAFEQYALKNVHEFFAVNYQHALCERYGIALEREHDEDGLLAGALRLYERPG